MKDLGFETKVKKNSFNLKYLHGDQILQQEIDIVEEIVRIKGYDENKNRLIPEKTRIKANVK